MIHQSYTITSFVLLLAKGVILIAEHIIKSYMLKDIGHMSIITKKEAQIIIDFLN